MVTAIDPPGCGCTECITGEYRPLQWASTLEMAMMCSGLIANNLHEGTKVEIVPGEIIVTTPNGDIYTFRV